MLKLAFLVSGTVILGAAVLSQPARAGAQEAEQGICEKTECPNAGTQVCAVVTVPLPPPGEGTIAYNCFQRVNP